jgi:hypothetical protein
MAIVEVPELAHPFRQMPTDPGVETGVTMAVDGAPVKLTSLLTVVPVAPSLAMYSVPMLGGLVMSLAETLAAKVRSKRTTSLAQRSVDDIG